MVLFCDSNERVDFKRDPHLRQHIRLNDNTCIQKIPLSELKRSLDDSMPERPYTKIPRNVRTTVHLGQRKLLLSEIDFLTEFSRPNDIVIYAGAAPGIHIDLLAKMYPAIKFVLFDPAKFKCTESDQIVSSQRYFTDDLANHLATRFKELGLQILFVSDIRTADPKVLTDVEVEEYVESDMSAQQRWVKILDPRASMLKFRLPWDKKKTQYLAGDIRLPVFGRQTTTETRLIVTDNSSVTTYDDAKYESQMFYFNTVYRTQYFEHLYVTDEFDHCYDCAAEELIIRAYIDKYVKPLSECTDKELIALIKDYLEQIDQYCSWEGTMTIQSKTKRKH